MTLPRQALSFLFVVAVACSGGPAPGAGAARFLSTVSPSPGDATSGMLESRACALPPEQLARVWRGHFAGRSGEIQLVTKEPHVIGDWFPHSGPAEDLQRVPMLWYGPGHVPAVGVIQRPATMADVAPTLAEFLRFGFDAPDGAPMTEALLAEEERGEPPKLVFVVVWDGGGRNLLSAYPDEWPNLARLIQGGAWFDNFTVGSSPSMTAPVHATLGTGAFPRRHGVVDARLRLGGRLTRPENVWPRVLKAPTLADLYDRGSGNRPTVGVVASNTWHLSMLGVGSSFEGGDRDLAILHGDDGWGLFGRGSRFYQTRDYPNSVSGFPEALREMDIADGRLDGRWWEEEFDRPEVLRRTPAFTEWQTKILGEVIRREGFGADATPDLLYANYKQIDLVGHAENMNSLQMKDVLRAADRALGDLVRILDRNVGAGKWVLGLTADHGLTPPKSLTGAVFMVPRVLRRDLRAVFDDDGDARGIIDAVRPTEMWVDVEELEGNGFTLEDMAGYLSEYTRGQYDDRGTLSDAQRRSERLFSVAIPGPMLERLSCLPGSS